MGVRCRKRFLLLFLLVSILFLVSCVPQQISDEELAAELAKLTPEEREALVKDLENEKGAFAGQAIKSAKYGATVAKAPVAQIKVAIKNLPVPVPNPQCGSDQECPYAYACIKNKCVPKEKTETVAYRNLTFAELDKIDVTVPILHILAAPSNNMYAWISDDNIAWEQIFQSDAHYLKNNKETEFYILLNRIPRYVRVGGTPYGGVAVDFVEIILPDGKKILPVSAKVNDLDVTNMKDNNYADLNLGLNLSLEFPITSSSSSQKYSLNLQKVPLKSPKVGFYATTYSSNDPSQVPTGYVYVPNASEFVIYDFTVLQANPGLDGLEQKNFITQLKEKNPQQKVILRLGVSLPSTEGSNQLVLDYYYDQAFREKVKNIVLNQIERVNSFNLYGVTLNEEELAIQFSGFHNPTVPAWLNRFILQYEAETGKKFVHQSPEVVNWLSGKAKFMFNDLYNAVDVKYKGKPKIIQWLYIPGDNSGWGWIEPKELNKNGWVIQWHGDDKVSLLKPAVHKLPEITTVYVKERNFNIQAQKLRDAGVPNDEIYANINGYDSIAMGTALWQLERVREAGINNVFVFYAFAFLPPLPLIDNYPEFYSTQSGTYWKESYKERQEIENYIKKLKNKS
ncbi:hypothetical protein HY494_00990 [Candidatus Woesearchaeota archaeon]|nr:hypothetical protein [Candidatus Woesearchaeota archaeon]